MANKFEYFIIVDESKKFSAEVRNEEGVPVFEFNGFDIFIDGFMRNKHDIVGLRDYLINLKILTAFDTLKSENEKVSVFVGKKNKN